MRRLPEFELVALIKQMERDYWQYRLSFPDEILRPYHRPARLEFPLGELTNPHIAGFIWVWHKLGLLKTGRIERSDRFNAQGLEGKCLVSTCLSSALLAARELSPYRRAVYAGQ